MSGFLTGRLARIGDYMRREFIDTGKIAGCQALVARGGEVGLFDQWGLADIERGRPIAPDTIFRIMSMTKPLTATALMILLEEGRFRLDDPVRAFLPAFRNARVYVSGAGQDMVTEPARRPLTVRDMLRHTAGLTYGHALEPMRPDETVHPVEQAYLDAKVDLARNVPMMTFVDRIAQVPLLYHPGEGWTYSMASDVGGALVEAISGQRYEVFLRERVLGPLQMHDTDFSVPDGKADRFAASYRRGRDGRLVLFDDPETSAYRAVPEFCSGGGGLVGTTPDYFRFCEMIRRGGELDGERILSPRAVRLMTTNHLPGGADIAGMSRNLFQERGNDGVGYGLGFAMTFDPVKSGTLADNDVFWAGFHCTLFWVDPIADLSVVFMTQFMPARVYDFRGPLRSLVYSSLAD